jgi:carbamoyl-phosphate synthase/aspartate carbamoyltransferase/dihydroorotase
MGKIITLPGLIDPHVHLRDPGQTDKEDFYTGTSAALAGGYTTVMDMPNNLVPVTTLDRLEEKIESARKRAVCDIGFHFGTLGDNFDEFPKVIDKVMGLKIYLNVTTGGFVLDQAKLLDVYKAWPAGKPILLHVESDDKKLLDTVLSVIKKVKKQTHICHVSSIGELTLAMKAKDLGLPVSCGTTPDYLFLSEEDRDRVGPYMHMKPRPKTKRDQDFLWSHIDAIDVIESDHAPHTKAEKDSDNPPFGAPGLETTLPLMLTAEAEGRITRAQLLDRLHANPARIFGITPDKTTHIEVDMSEYEIKNEDLLTKCGWSQFAGMRVVGKVKKTVLRGETVFENGRVLAKPGSGRILPD